MGAGLSSTAERSAVVYAERFRPPRCGERYAHCPPILRHKPPQRVAKIGTEPISEDGPVSLAVPVRDQGVAGSNPVSPTILAPALRSRLPERAQVAERRLDSLSAVTDLTL